MYKDGLKFHDKDFDGKNLVLKHSTNFCILNLRSKFFIYFSIGRSKIFDI